MTAYSDIPEMTLGQRITALRKKNHMSQQVLADLLNIQRQTLSHYERDEREPSISVLVHLASIFSVSLDLLINGKAMAEINS